MIKSLFKQTLRTHRATGLRAFGGHHGEVNQFGNHVEPIPMGELPEEYDKDEILSVHQLGAGKMYQEAQARLLNMRLYDQAPLTGPFGTFDHPAPILSNFNNRVVGCLGGGNL